jgi:IS4 transposase
MSLEANDMTKNQSNDLGQISMKATAHNPNPWVVVEFPGTDNENIVVDFPTAREAFRYIERNYTEDECDVDVMRRRDGVLTTEF